jgi:2-amino-4-hydroxy-6-hydroxymethyldihydropteridine diphosphokinase
MADNKSVPMANNKSVLTYIALGSNIGDRRDYIEKATQAIDLLPECKVLEVAPIIETKPQGYTEQPNFFNTVIAVETSLTAEELLRNMLEIELQLDRKRTIRWGPRTIDIDILFYGQEIIEQSNLVIPHPRLHERDFVLIPMRSLNKDFIHPILGQTIEQIYLNAVIKTTN